MSLESFANHGLADICYEIESMAKAMMVERSYEKMRKKKALVNIAFSLVLEFVSILSGFVIPHILINQFGSDVNGLTNAISNFLGYITVLQLGAGSVIKTALYKPLAKQDSESLSVTIATSNRFFRRIGFVGLIYMMVLACVMPIYKYPNEGFFYTFSLVVVIGIGIIAQYLFGITYQMILEADQKAYIYSIAQIITILLNTISALLLSRAGYSIQVIKLFSSVFFVLRPVALAIYVNKKYKINRSAVPDNKLISQRWNGFAHGLAYFIHSKTDIFVLTLFSALSDVSIYSVYAMITTGLSSFITWIDNAVRSALGNIWANKEIDNFKKAFEAYNTLMHIIAVCCFSTAAISVTSFIEIYTKTFTDADYQQPVFAVMIIIATMFYCLRMPYNSVVFVANKFKETKRDAFAEAIINIVISCALVRYLGLVGVAVGTIIAMIYRTITFITFLTKNILYISILGELKKYGTSILAFFITTCLAKLVNIEINNYFSWFIYAACVFVITSCVVFAINYFLQKENVCSAIKLLFHR